jgi:peptidoglycan/LPS O-acetylase OafA/YrhL
MKRIFGLDLMRAFAIVWVLYVHCAYIVYPFFPKNMEVVYNYLNWMGGYYSVDLFFVLSGFLIGSLFVEEFIVDAIRNVSKQINYFWIKRWFRTLPNYYLFIILNVVVYYFISNKNYLYLVPKYAFFLQKLKPTDELVMFGVSWSLAIEEWFYLFLPGIFLLLYKITTNKKLSFGVPLALMFIVPLVMKVCYITTHARYGMHDEFFKFTTFARLDPIGYGVLFAYVWHTDLRSYLLKNKNKLALTGLIVFFIAIVYSFLFLAKPVQNSIAYSFISSISSIALFLQIPYLIEFKPFKNKIVCRVIETLSKISYSMYLCHILVLELVEYFSKGMVLFDSNIGRLIKILLIYTISILFSLLLYKKFEKPFLNLRRKFAV